MAAENKKIFPLRLPQNYHGALKAKQSLANTAKSNWLSSQKEREDLPVSSNVSKWQKKRLNSDIYKERKQMLVHPGRISEQNPEWLKTTYNYFRKNSVAPIIKQSRQQRQSYNVFGLPKVSSVESTPVHRHRFSQGEQVTSKIGWENRLRSTGFKEVSSKVGSIETRDLKMPHHQLKVGSSAFVNTYSPF